MNLKLTVLATDPDLHIVLDSTEMYRVELYSPAVCEKFYEIGGRFCGNCTRKR